jgi:hypothetical protein
VSARRGWANSHPHTRPLFVGGPATVCVRIALAFAFLGATGGLRPPLLVVLQCGDFPAKLRLVRCTNAHFQERRASARRGTAIAPATARLLPDVDAPMPRGAYAPRSWRCYNDRQPEERQFLRCTHSRLQERRASARRGTGNNCRAVRIEHRPATGDTAIKSGARQPAVGMKRTCNGARFFRERVRSPTTAGLRQPLLVHGIGRPKNNDIRGAQTHVF